MSYYRQPHPTDGEAPSHGPSDVVFAPGKSLARTLGWMSLGLGAAEFMFPGSTRRAMGLRSDGLVAAYGLREIVCGVGILNSARPTRWMWARVAGDALDLATLAWGARQGTARQQENAALAAAVVTGVLALDTVSALQQTTAESLTG